MRDILLVALVLGCAVIALGRPYFGMLSFVSFGLVNIQSFTWGFGRTFPLEKLIAGSTIVGYIFSNEEKRLPRHRECGMIIALWLTCVVGTLFGAVEPERSFDQLLYLTKVWLMVLLLTSMCNDAHRFRLLIRVTALSIGFYAIKGGLFSIATGGNYRVFGPDGTFIAGANPLGMALSMNIPFLVYLLKVETSPWLRRLVLAMLALSFPAVVFTYSRGAWLSLAAVTGQQVLKSQRKFAILSAAAVLGLAVFSFGFFRTPEPLKNRFNELVDYEDDRSAVSRFWNWEFCARVGIAHPLFGAGGDYYSLRAYEIYFPEFLREWPGKVWSCHNAPLMMFSEHGFIGLGLWLGLIISTLMSVRRVARADTTREAGGARDVADMIQGALLAYVVAGLFFDATYFDLFYQLPAMAVMLKEGVLTKAPPAQIVLSRATR
jgi:probable O-glycosylation ligase (exosortase A-associated)